MLQYTCIKEKGGIMSENKLGRIINDARSKLGISQRELARRSGVDIAEISRIESGARKKPNVLSLSKIAHVLSVSNDELMKSCGYSDEEINIYNNRKYSNFFIGDKNKFIRSMEEIILNQRYEAIIKKYTLELFDKYSFFDSSLYKELSKEEQEEINIIYDNYKSNLVESITHAENFYNEAFNEKKNTKN